MDGTLMGLGHLEVGISACSDRAKDDVLWFRNWTSLQSVRAIEHVHILVRDAPKDLIESLTGKMS